MNIDFIWDYLPKDPEHSDRRVTGWGTKTKKGLDACLRRYIEENPELPEGVSSPPSGYRFVGRGKDGGLFNGEKKQCFGYHVTHGQEWLEIGETEGYAPDVYYAVKE